jgi:peptidoglycan/xylan/chitin deacetylase (PgdA/CDA1 family)
MKMNNRSLSKVPLFVASAVIIFVMLLFQGCAQRGASPDFIPVIVKPGETLSSLAKKYLDDPDKSWVIADFNDVTSVSAGQEIIIPLEPFGKGGLSSQGYQTVPILAYHNFSATNEDLMMVRKNKFEQQMGYLKKNGYTVITLDELFDFLEYRTQLPRKAVVLTFDDGWKGVYTIAFPILKKYDFPATLFVYTDLINGNKKTLSWAQVAELDRGGVDIQCHTKTHRNLNTIEDNESLENYVRDVKNEITESARIIKGKLNKEVKYLAYPYGDTNNLVVAFLKQKGYRGAFTVKRDANPFFMDHYSLNRSMIYGDFDLNDFKKNLRIYSRKALN